VVRDLYPGCSVADIAKELGRRWELCADRAKYEAMAMHDKLRYQLVSARTHIVNALIYNEQCCCTAPTVSCSRVCAF